MFWCVSRSFFSHLEVPRVGVAVAKVACVIGSILAMSASSASAGTYTMTDDQGGHYYSGGELSIKPTYAPPGYYPRPYQYDSSNGTYGAWGDASGSNCETKCLGAITAVLHWKESYAGEPLPKSVIVVEHAWANYGAAQYSNPGPGGDPGSCTTSMANEVASTPSPPNEGPQYVWNWGRSKSAVRYKVETGAPTITVTCSPQAQSKIDSGPHCVASVSYQVAGYPVEIGLQGATPINSNGTGGATVLIGQGLTANLVGGGATFTGHNWNASGGQPFKSWSVSSNQSSSQLTNMVSTDWNVANPTWYFAKPEDATVTCSAQAIASDGTSIGPVQAEKQVPVRAPIVSFTATTYGCNFSLTFSDIHAGPPTPSNEGIEFTARTETPSPFNAQGAGQQQAVHLINDYSFNESFPPYFSDYGGTNGNYWLDNAYPYTFGGGPASCAASNNPAYGKMYPSDSPLEGVHWYTKAVTISDQFKMYLMYQPPAAGNGVQWVPVSLIEWFWSVDTSRSAPSDNTIWTSNPPGTTTSYGAQDSFGSWPSWSNRYVNSP